MWRSLVARTVRDGEVAGSNPVTPTTLILFEHTPSEFRSEGILAAILRATDRTKPLARRKTIHNRLLRLYNKRSMQLPSPREAPSTTYSPNSSGDPESSKEYSSIMPEDIQQNIEEERQRLLTELAGKPYAAVAAEAVANNLRMRARALCRLDPNRERY